MNLDHLLSIKGLVGQGITDQTIHGLFSKSVDYNQIEYQRAINSYRTGQTPSPASEKSGRDVDADPSRPPAGIVDDVVEVIQRDDVPILVNDAIRFTSDGLSPPADGPRSPVFMSRMQTVGFFRYTSKGAKVYDRHPDVGSAVFEKLRDIAMPCRIGGASLIKGQWVGSRGLHRESAFYCTEADPVMPYKGTPDQAIAELVDGVFGGFPLVDVDAPERILAMVLTPFCASSIDGSIPAVLLSAPNRGDGKTLAAKASAILSDGSYSLIPWGNDAKFSENLLAAIDGPHRVIVVDNVRGELGGSALEALITSRTVRGNLKYERSRIFNVDKLIVLTGNHVRMTPDMARRVMRIRLDRKGAPTPPGLRDLESCLPAERPRWLGIIKVILGAWKGDVLPVSGHRSFETWAGTMAAILRDCGRDVSHLRLIDPEAVAAEHDADAVLWGDVLSTWFTRWGTTPVTSGELIASLGKSTFTEITRGHRGDTARALGGILQAMHGRIILGYRITKVMLEPTPEARQWGYLLEEISHG